MDTVKIGESIAEARKKGKLTQEDLADKVGVSVQAVSKWENGRNLPDIENLLRIAEITNVPYSYLIDAGRDNEDDIGSMAVRERLFQEDNMFTRVRSFAQSEKLTETYQAVQYMRVHHAGQVRDKAKFSTEDVKYINHPLLMACQAHAFGIRDDQLLAAILLHDVVEQSEGKIKVMDLPFSDEVKELVRLVTFTVPIGKTQDEAEDEYYRKISDNKKASVIKVIFDMSFFCFC